MKAKKIIFSVAFLALFGAYAMYQKMGADSISPVLTNSIPAPSVPDNSTPQKMMSGNTPQMVQGKFRNGHYMGSYADAFYGFVQVQAIISNGKLTDIKFINYPSDRQHSIQLSNYAMPQLKTEAIQAQNANVNVISGATATSQAFMQSLASALSQAS